MSSIVIQSNDPKANQFALFNLGFRAFFLGAGVFAVVSIALWAGIYLFQLPIPLRSVSTYQWHAHEMIYGYSMAVISGFLLTAVRNWTGIQTITQRPLMLLFLLWACARLLWLTGDNYLLLAAVFDMLFSVYLLLAVSRPIIKVSQWKQLAIISKLGLLVIFNLLFYLGAYNLVSDGLNWGVYGGLYLVISLILTMGRRVVPFFIERGVGYPVSLYNNRWIDIASMLLFLAFFINELFFTYPLITTGLSVCLFIINATRLIGWHTPGIWKKSLLWSLYLSFWFICLGFLLFALLPFTGISRYIAIHAFAIGGIGLVTLSMMSRVALGHTGRDIGQPPKAIGYAAAILLLGTASRVLLPILDMQHYAIWIGLSQVMWIAAFLVFTLTCLPVCIKPRVDGQPG